MRWVHRAAPIAVALCMAFGTFGVTAVNTGATASAAVITPAGINCDLAGNYLIVGPEVSSTSWEAVVLWTETGQQWETGNAAWSSNSFAQGSYAFAGGNRVTWNGNFVGAVAAWVWVWDYASASWSGNWATWVNATANNPLTYSGNNQIVCPAYERSYNAY